MGVESASVLNKCRSNPNAPAVRVHTPNPCAYQFPHAESCLTIACAVIWREACLPRSMQRAHPRNGLACLRYHYFITHPMVTVGFVPLHACGRPIMRGRCFYTTLKGMSRLAEPDKHPNSESGHVSPALLIASRYLWVSSISQLSPF
jgi:hypothetical protein